MTFYEASVVSVDPILKVSNLINSIGIISYGPFKQSPTVKHSSVDLKVANVIPVGGLITDGPFNQTAIAVRDYNFKVR